MRPLEEHMGMYTAYHRHPMNRFIHFIMVPAIVWTIMVWTDLLTLFTVGSTAITLMFVLVGAVVIWYLMLDFVLGVAMAAVYSVLMVAAIQLNIAFSPGMTSLIAGGVFVASWVFQFIGHGVWEKRRPAFADNLLQLLVGPMFLVAETFFAMGLKKELRERVEAVASQHAKSDAPHPKDTHALAP